MNKLKRIVSGGQTGADRAALDIAIALGIAYGGWCPKGGWAEDFPDPPGLLARYPRLKQTPSRLPGQRTKWNVRDSDATLLLAPPEGIGGSEGTRYARHVAEKLGRGWAVVTVDEDVRETRRWLEQNLRKGVLNIAGPRESEAPGLYARACDFLARLLAG